MSTASPPELNVAILEEALAGVAAGAGERDRAPVPTFPEEAIADLEAVGALAWNAQPGPGRPSAAAELGLVRSIARADGSVGRIVDGHLNGVERLAVQAPPDLRERELAAVRAGRLRVGVWGGDPRPGEGTPAAIEPTGSGEVLTGVKTFCSGAGGLDRALVLARDPDAPAPAAVWIDLTDPATVIVDDRWYRGAGMRASVSHRVVFNRAPVLARLGGPGALARQPWFGRDALRTAASWAGMADCAVDGGLEVLAERASCGPLEELAIGRMLTAQETISAWLERAARAMDGASEDLPDVSLYARAAIAQAARTILGEGERACGSHPFATGGRLDRARRDLELFLLQHRLDPALAAAGARALAPHRSAT
ncbi:MAG TPA: acyl-CoA dehydrogenase family protein [Solirubrobacteraceae bacterium]